jgi:hypothetical protein
MIFLFFNIIKEIGGFKDTEISVLMSVAGVTRRK